MRRFWLVNILLLLLVVLLLILLLTKSCCDKQPQPLAHIPVDMSQVVIWKNPDSSETSFKDYIHKHFANSTTNIMSYCNNCDSDLVLISGPDVVLYLQGQTSTAGSGKKNSAGGTAGGDGPVLFSLNFPIDFGDSATIRDSLNLTPIPINTKPQGPEQKVYNSNAVNRNGSGIGNSFLPVPSPGTFSQGDTVTVAVFDTGLDSTSFAPYLYKSSINSCLGSRANSGWNFIDTISNWNDDYTPPHGTLVSHFIIDQALLYNSTFVKILPVKIFGNNGQSHLYDVLCGLSYAKDRGADIINASFGFYGLKDNLDSSIGILLFQKFLKKYLNDSDHVMLMLAAAGNKDLYERYVYYSTDPVAMRNLDSVSFYPASFAKDIPNVIAVTTVSERLKKVSPHQNFSSKVVDVGVDAELIAGDTAFLFKDPMARNNPGEILTVEGSSFATPIAAGKIAANYSLIRNLINAGPLQPHTKEAILDTLKAHNLLHIGVNELDTKIKGKNIMIKLR